MGRLPMDSHSQFSYPSPQPQAAYYSCAPPPQLQTQPQQAFIVYPQPQNNVNVAQVPPYQTSSPVAAALPQNQHLAHIVIPTNGSLQSNAPIGKSVQHLPMPSPQMKAVPTGNADCATSGIVYAVAPCFVSGPYRKKLRRRFGLIEAPASDRIIHSIFEPCALCQEYRELKNRGINPAL
ncbi:hypothetical protein Goarm_007047, partial [Gossypium armourianum]|nr:hypothetical protein [Gossypium armourianum]